MENPIQIVLDAETEAQQQIEYENQAAQERIRLAQLQAREIRRRNEMRTERVATRYEDICRRDLKVKISEMIAEAEKNLDQFTHLSRDDRNQIVESVFLSLSPLYYDADRENSDGC